MIYPNSYILHIHSNSCLMKNIYLIILPFLVIMEISCQKDLKTGKGLVCTEQAVSGLTVNVILQNSTILDESGISVIAKDGEYVESLRPYISSSQLYFLGAIERKGNYIITVTKLGYKTFTSNINTVNADSCHVIPQIVNVVLQEY